ncbi:MAG: glycine cleavage system aminomethyltransferase GcvT, partial [Elusimicrobiota bacterium]
CHMGEFTYNGDLSYMGHALTQHLAGIPEGRCKYGFILNETGGIIDDLIVFRTGTEEIMLVVNAATTDNNFKVLKDRLSRGKLTDVSEATAKLDLQGPLSREIIKDTLNIDLNLKYFGFSSFRFMNKSIIISRTGYTGELGYEIYSDNETAIKIWELLIADKRVKPAGLGARDILRLEMGYCLYGSDLDENTTPLEAGMGFLLDFNKDFIGKKALTQEKESGSRKIRIAFKTDSRRSPRKHNRIFSGEKEIGEVTSGSFSPILSCGIGMGYVETGYEKADTPVLIQDGRKTTVNARISELPFYRNGSLTS